MWWKSTKSKKFFYEIKGLIFIFWRLYCSLPSSEACTSIALSSSRPWRQSSSSDSPLSDVDSSRSLRCRKIPPPTWYSYANSHHWRKTKRFWICGGLRSETDRAEKERKSSNKIIIKKKIKTKYGEERISYRETSLKTNISCWIVSHQWVFLSVSHCRSFDIINILFIYLIIRIKKYG